MSVPRTDAKMEIVKKSRSISGSRKSKTRASNAGASDSLGKNAFTLIELLVVITIIVILMGLLFPAFRGVQDQAKKTQSKNDLTQIVTAVNAFYTEYGKYPIPSSFSGTEYSCGGTSGTPSKVVFDALRGLDPSINPRQVVFINPADAKDQSNPRAGMGPPSNGQFYDPWGTTYAIRIDSDYDNQVTNPYGATGGAGP